jgi:hypothetical protein
MVGLGLKKKRILESDVEKWVIRNLSRIDKGLKYVGRQVDLKEYGRLDILCKDSKGKYVIVELKGPEETIDETILSQVFKYRTGLSEKREFRITNPSDIRILCFANKIDAKARKICKQAGIGIATYDLKEIDLPAETVGELPGTELKHGIFPVHEKFFRKLDKYCFYDIGQSVSWIKQGSIGVFYSEKMLRAEFKVLEIAREFESTKRLDEFLQKIGYFDKLGDKLNSTVIVHDGLTKYNPPVWWDSYLHKFRPHDKFYLETPMAIDDIELAWIRGK